MGVSILLCNFVTKLETTNQILKVMKLTRLLLTLTLLSLVTFTYADKKKNAKYIERRSAAIEEMFSILHGDPRPMMEIADKKCKEFKYDPELMREIAKCFYSVGLTEQSIQRFQQIKRMYPNDFKSYSDYAAILFDLSIRDDHNDGIILDSLYFNLAKAQMDSAKVAFPKSKEPYQWWLLHCAPYTYNWNLLHSFKNEVETFRKAFPRENADYEAAKILSDNAFKVVITNSKTPSYAYFPEEENEDISFRIERSYAFHRSELARKYYDKVDINSLQADELCKLTYFYYQCTESKYVSRDERALLHEKGLECAKLGVEKYPLKADFHRFMLWHAAELAKNREKFSKYLDNDLQAQKNANYETIAEQGLVGAERLMTMTDTLLRQDYYFAAVVNQIKGYYDVAIENYQKAMGTMRYFKNIELPYKTPYHNCDSIIIYQNIARCYNSAKEYDKAISQQKALINLIKKHAGLKYTDLLDLIRYYGPLADDPTRTQKERFATYITIDTLYAEIQDSVDADKELIDFFPKGYEGVYLYRRLINRSKMDKLDDFSQRENYQAVEIAEEIVKRIEPLPEKSEREIIMMSLAYEVIWRDYYKKEDYKNALTYINLEIKYDPSKKEIYKNTLDALAKLARRQR